MVKALTFDKITVKKGAWSEEEDNKLRAYIQRYGHWNWGLLPKFAGLSRSGKSCRLRWMNYLRPDIKHGNFTKEDDDMIVTLHKHLGNKWTAIAAKLPGRSDNEIKNRWNSHLKKRVQDDKTESENDHNTESLKPDEVPSCSSFTELPSCNLSDLDYGASSDVTPQTYNCDELSGDFLTEPFLLDITSSIENIPLPIEPLYPLDNLVENTTPLSSFDDFFS
ncbi:hypothetical protein LXL04_024690 [Taraxacum kok-saghyz]